MEQKDAVQDIKMESLKEFLNEKFSNVGKDIARLDGKYTEFERKNCEKHTVIQDLVSSYRGEVSHTLQTLREEIKQTYVSKMEARPTLDFFDSIQKGSLKIIIVLVGIISIGVYTVLSFLGK